MDDGDATTFVLGLSYWFAPNSKFYLATKDWEMHEWDELYESIQDEDFFPRPSYLVAKV